jgi:hypothetical protein
MVTRTVYLPESFCSRVDRQAEASSRARGFSEQLVIHYGWDASLDR